MTTPLVIDVQDVRKRYRRRDPLAVDGVSLSIGPGQVFGLLGPNGAGKTTIVKMNGSSWPDILYWAAYLVVLCAILYWLVRRRQV